MLKIELNPADCQVKTRQVIGKNGTRNINEQQAYLHTGSAYPMPFTLSLRNASEAYPAGEYTLAPESFQVNQYGGLELNRFELKLTPVSKTLKSATA